MLFVILLLFVASSISVEEEHVEFEPFPDYYAMLNVSHEASMKEIKRSFRKLAMGYHPDKNKSEGAQMIFQELSEAYSVLGDAEKKAEYDELFKHFYDISENDVDENPADTSDNSVKEDSPAEDLKAEDQETAEAPSTEQEDASSTVKDEGSSTAKDEAADAEENSDEMDDETLFKVLKFLAENDYIITKRTKRTPSNNEESFYNSEDESRKKRSADSTNTRHYSEYRTGSQNSSGQRGHTGGHTGGHHGHDHAWTHSHQHKPRSEHQNARYSNQFHGSEQVYCRTNIRWEGNVKITSKTCL